MVTLVMNISMWDLYHKFRKCAFIYKRFYL